MRENSLRLRPGRVLIIGAGPTGLGCAHRLQQQGHADWLLLEAEAEAGGLAGSVVDEKGFTWDLGGHVQFSHYPDFDRLMDELLGEEGWLEHVRESWVQVGEHLVPFPVQLNLRYLPEPLRRRCVAGLEALEGRSRAEPDSFGAWIQSVFGAGLCDVFMRPYNEKVWAHPLDSLSHAWVGDRVAAVDLKQVRAGLLSSADEHAWGPNARFLYPRQGGTGAVWRALSARLPGERQRFSARVVAVDSAKRQVGLTDGSKASYDTLISTMPLDRLIALSDLGELAPHASRLVHSSVHVVGIGLRGDVPEGLATKNWMYFPSESCPFYRVTVLSNYAPSNVPEGAHWSLLAEISESGTRPVDAGRIIDQTIDAMLATGLIESKDGVVSRWHRRLEHGYPTPTLRRDEALGVLLPALEERGIYSRGRFGAWKYEVSNQDHSYAQGREVADRILTGASEPTLEHPAVVNRQRGR